MSVIAAVSALATFAPDIIGWIAGDKAESAAQKVADMATSLTGTSSVDEAVNAMKNNPETAIEFKRMVLDSKNELDRLYLADRANAREMHGKHPEQADKIANRITVWNVPYVILMVVINCLVVFFLKDNVALVAIASNVIGMVIKSLLDQMQSVTGFYFGSSMGSKEKDRSNKSV